MTTFKVEQAGLLKLSKNFPPFVYEEELRVLGMPYFYLGTFDYILIIFILRKFSAYYFLGVGLALSTILFICENLTRLCKKITLEEEDGPQTVFPTDEN